MGDYSFAQVPLADIPRSKFNRSHGHKTTFDAGLLVPVFCDEVLPGDTFQVNASVLARMNTPVVPVMDNLYLDMFYFFVPNRLIWRNWQKFCGEQENPDDSIDYVIPHITAGQGGFDWGSIYDYFGVPVGVEGIEVNALPFRAYNLIYNEWFRDQNLQDRVDQINNDGPDDVTSYEVRRRGKRHDYFTSCLPWPQKGPGVMVEIGESAPVIRNPDQPIPYFASENGNVQLSQLAGDPSHLAVSDTVTTGRFLPWAPGEESTGLVADLTESSAVTINALRQAFQIQKLLERDARGGTRYVEILRSHFGVVSPDARLQRPEYLGGGSVPVTINPVPQNSATAVGQTPQGNLAAYGVVAGRSMGFSKSFVEHGYVIGLACVRADLNYQQGMHRMWSRQSRYDFYWPAFANLGEQAVLRKEIYCNGDADPLTGDDSVFGYQERWAEYRYFPSKITGAFRTGNPNGAGLDMWHLAQHFETPPTLGADFIEENPPMARVLAVLNYPNFFGDFHFQMNCTRPMPTYSVPGMIDHF